MRYEVVGLEYNGRPVVFAKGDEPFAVADGKIFVRRRVRWWERLKTNAVFRHP